MDFAAVLERLAAFFESRNHRFALIGGVGLAAYGIARATVDLDLVVDASAQEEVIAFLESLGYETLYRSTSYSNHQHPTMELARVELVYVRGETSRRVFDAARTLPGPGNLQIRVPIPEHLIAMKVAAMKNDPSRTYQDMADIRSLLSIPGVDREEVRPSSRSMDSWSVTLSSKRPEPLDLDRDLPTTPEDIAALRRIRESRHVRFEDYLRFLSRYELPVPAHRPRKTHRGCAPFEL